MDGEIQISEHMCSPVYLACETQLDAVLDGIEVLSKKAAGRHLTAPEQEEMAFFHRTASDMLTAMSQIKGQMGEGWRA
jgi:hypothetical protein